MAASINEDRINELIRLSLNYRNKAGLGSKLTETAIQKILYELKRNLPETNPIRDDLAYYWFKAGVYSEYVTHGLEKMTDSGILKKEQNQNYVLFELNQDVANKRIVEHDQHLEEARALLQKIVSNLQPYSIYNEIRSQYEDDAPSLFYPRFKLGFLPNVEGYYRSITSEENGKNRFQRDCMSKLLNVSTSSLPINSLFSNFKKTYFDFETSFYRIMRFGKKESDVEYQNMVKQAVELAEEIWNTFAYGARIIKHDPIYEIRVEEWKDRFEEETKKLTSKINEFYLNVLDKTKPKDFDEQVISLQKFVDLIVKGRQEQEIIFINFQHAPDISRIIEKIDDDVISLPEFSTFKNQGQLDWEIIKTLNDDVLKEIIESCVSYEPVYVAFSSDAGKTITYRIEPNSLTVAEQPEIQR